MINLYELTNIDAKELTGLNLYQFADTNNSMLFATVLPAVFVGRDVSSEAYIPDNQYGVGLVRYAGFGGPVYFDAGNIFCSLVVDSVPGGKQNIIDYIQKSLMDLGISTTHEPGTNDILLDGKKISGVSYIEKDLKINAAFFLSLHIDFAIAKAVMILTKHTANLEERAIGINDVLGKPVTSEQIKESLVNNFENYFSGIPSKAVINNKATEPYMVQASDAEWIKYGQKLS